MKRLAIGLALIATWGCSSAPFQGDGGVDAASPMIDAGPPDAGSQDDAGPTRDRCDEPGEVCCADGRCGGGLPCNGGLCGFLGCGQLGEPCCATGACDLLSGAVCEDGNCVAPHCGSEGYECCADEPACREDFVCHEGSCLRCGDLGESCCPGGACEGTYYCLPEAGTLGQCIAEAPPCGGEYEGCCADGPSCDPGLGCQTGPDGFGSTCVPGPACGAEGRVCCEVDPRCGAAMICVSEDGTDRCRRCGGFEQPCCDAPTACGPSLICGVDETCVLPPA